MTDARQKQRRAQRKKKNKKKKRTKAAQFRPNSGARAAAPTTHIAGDIAIVDGPTLGTGPLSHVGQV
jgi:hypothetical protein